MKVILYLRLLRESFSFALHALIVNKLRTFLSLLGITIGIFAVISVFTVFDSMESYVRNSIESLGDNVLFITKSPWIQTQDSPWWDYINRPNPSLEEMKEIQSRSYGAEACAYMLYTNKTIKYQSKSIENADVIGVSDDYDRIITFGMDEGRYFSPIETTNGRNVAIVGHDIADGLFEGGNPIGKTMKMSGRKLEIIGVIEKEGESTFGESSDQRIIVPINFLRNLVDIHSDFLYSHIVVLGKEHISNTELIDELTGIMRSIRRLKPAADDNFAINEKSALVGFFDDVFGAFAIAGWLIGGFSLLVGGFGIANIMFVSVHERTHIIGIQKSVGARNYFILLEFIFESIFLSLIGGCIGLLFVLSGTLLISSFTEMELSLTSGNIILGLSVSFIIGLISGIVPAIMASRLNPVDAIRTSN